ncbi:hypothetical protein [Bradyrhizobium sp. CCBAU 51753]|uniref:hypothetical protein n=1 Tax=Bradyrhizobium sp. CCBAU 51753 TaxID=1325100 RepID=UPI001889E576|nr:hypothetical protein [Bradyrhizobium sp. CCBAU 51753]QOZ28358.1 hypothetical protein XH93_35695 [Bradyrhizobium sp. CCBAU 51753]
MNVVFHTLVSVATAAALSSRVKEKEPLNSTSNIAVLVAGFTAGVLSHGLLDWLPHQYPLRSIADVVVSLILFSGVWVLARKEARWILLTCFLGAIFPDLVDLGPAVLNKQMQLSLPMVKTFPWHWKEYSGSIYDGSRRWLSIANHLAVVAASGLLILQYRRGIIRRYATPSQNTS